MKGMVSAESRRYKAWELGILSRCRRERDLKEKKFRAGMEDQASFWRGW